MRARSDRAGRIAAQSAAWRKAAGRVLCLVLTVACVAFAGLVSPLRAQDAGVPLAPSQSNILTVDTDFIFANSLYGVQIEQDFNAAAQILIAENGEIEARLTTQEKALTDERASLSLEEFRTRAQAFDIRVQALREEQRVKETEVQAIRATGRQTFQEVLTPVLTKIARERGASVMFERQQVFLSAESIDVTLEALEMVNEAFKETQAQQDPDAPQVTTPTPENGENDGSQALQSPAVEAPASGTQE
ncbi:MAG: Skp family chaperone for outer membrane protein [Halocynthiibacter sp.]|jgi:Skp family chaperone for outer membrane proteins